MDDSSLGAAIDTLARKVSPAVLAAAVDTLLAVLRNILDHPADAKYRQIKTNNARFQQSFWAIPEARQLLFLVGFQEVREVVVLPGMAELSKLRKLYVAAKGYVAGVPLAAHDLSWNISTSSMAVPPPLLLVSNPRARYAALSSLELATYMQQRLEEKRATTAAAGAAAVTTTTPSSSGVPAVTPFPLFSSSSSSGAAGAMQMTAGSQAMMAKLRNGFEHVLKYENRAAQQVAVSCVPVQELTQKAEERLKLRPESSMQEELVRQLLRWFKFQFFTWIDQQPCPRCGGKMANSGMATPTPEDLRYGAHRVERFRCGSCGEEKRFPRYNDPVKLLESRTGRCGEWANCFTFLCRALGFDARHVLDWTDHVWTEVYIEKLGRWVHCDPSENAFDTPLLYEVGWGKKLSYIVAFSAEEIVDVARRYTRDIRQLLPRRREVPEEWLQQAIAALGAARLRTLSPGRVEMINARKAQEQVELSSPKQIKSDAELAGRQSGSVEWRKQRGEMGSQPSVFNEERKRQVFGPQNSEAVTTLGSASLVRSSASSPLRYRITPAVNDALGGVFFNEKVPFETGFVVTFCFQITGRGADGFAFVMHDAPTGRTTLGMGGSELGYGGIPNSMAVEFDMYENVDRSDDPDGNHISIHSRGKEPNVAHHDASLGCTSNKGVALPPLNSGDVYAVRIVYQPAMSKLSVLFSDVPKDASFSPGAVETLDFVPILEAPLKLDGIVQDGSARSLYMGFTGATGGLNQVHEVFEWTIHALL